jgi:hypothetical protein
MPPFAIEAELLTHPLHPSPLRSIPLGFLVFLKWGEAGEVPNHLREDGTRRRDG